MSLKATTNARRIAKATGLQRMAVARIIADPLRSGNDADPVADVKGSSPYVPTVGAVSADEEGATSSQSHLRRLPTVEKSDLLIII